MSSSNEVASSLEAINTVSRLLLSQIKTQVSPINETTNTVTETDHNQKPFTAEQLLNLVDERNTLITQLFNQHNQDELHEQLVLINEMVLLDGQITEESKQHKGLLGEQVIKLRKSQKASNLYKKY